MLTKLPQTWGGATAAGNPTVVTQAQSDNVPNGPFALETTFNILNAAPKLTTLDVTRDMAHRFFENQMELNGGSNDMFAAWEDAGGVTMGHWDYSQSKLWALAQQYVLADNFFMGAFGGSFLTHQYLICACAPSVPASFITSNSPSLNTLGAPNAKGVPQLAQSSSSPPSALTGAPSLLTGNITPMDYFGAGGWLPRRQHDAAALSAERELSAGGRDGPAIRRSWCRHHAAGADADDDRRPARPRKGVDWAWYATA